MAEPHAASNRRSHPPASSEAKRAGEDVLSLQMLPQPDDETCGPTCLHAVYRYWGEEVGLSQVIQSTRSLDVVGADRGTLAVMLGIDALTRGYQSSLFTFDLRVFDPTWFGDEARGSPTLLSAKLREQASVKNVSDPRFRVATESYLEFLKLGGRIEFRDLTGRLISRFMRNEVPVLTGVSATYLYRCAREFGPNDDYDDIRGVPTGHFVVLHGYDRKTRCVSIADPLADNPGFAGQRYRTGWCPRSCWAC
jgi:hypothetical protein